MRPPRNVPLMCWRVLDATRHRSSFGEMDEFSNWIRTHRSLRSLNPQNRQNPNNRKAPRAVLSLNRGFVELEAFTRNKLRRTPTIELYPWNAPPATKNGQPKPAKLDRDPLRLARYYQSLLDSGKFESRVALARFLGVSRARVTQVLNRLKSAADSMNPRSDHNEADVA